MTFIRVGLWLLALLGSMVALAAETSAPRLVLDKDGIKVWAYEVPGSPLYGFKAVTTVHSSLSSIVGLITDTEAAPRWLYRTSEVETLQRNDEDMSFTVRVVTDFPWPFKNREAVVAGKITQDLRTMQVRIDSRRVGGYGVLKDNVSMPEVQGSWIFRPMGQGQVEVTMTGHADPGGILPSALINLLVQEHPYRSLSALRELIASPQYQGYRVASIREP